MRHRSPLITVLLLVVVYMCSACSAAQPATGGPKSAGQPPSASKATARSAERPLPPAAEIEAALKDTSTSGEAKAAYAQSLVGSTVTNWPVRASRVYVWPDGTQVTLSLRSLRDNEWIFEAEGRAEPKLAAGMQVDQPYLVSGIVKDVHCDRCSQDNGYEFLNHTAIINLVLQVTELRPQDN